MDQERYKLHLLKEDDVDSIQELKSLLMEYYQAIPYDVSFQNISKELEELPAEYAPSQRGLFILARDSEQSNNLVGCVAYRYLESQTCEMKRLYVKPWNRGCQLGQKLAKSHGYKFMKLDTIQEFKTAKKLYDKMGFKPTTNYNGCPLKTAVFFQRQL